MNQSSWNLWRKRALLSSASAAVTLVFLELFMRLFFRYLPVGLTNELSNEYSTVGSGIYRFDSEWNMPRMRKHYARMMFFNGYIWHHQTDSMGYRNPRDMHRADVVLLGDSMIYGHGLEESATMRSDLERLTKLRVANLAEQSAALDYEYEILRHDVAPLHPKLVLAFFLGNDLTDLLSRLSDDEMRRFLASPVSDHTIRYFTVKPLPMMFGLRSLLSDLYVSQALRLSRDMLRRALAKTPKLWAESRPEAAARQLPLRADKSDPDPIAEQVRNQQPFANDPRMLLALRFHLYALLKMQNYADQKGFHFAYVFINAGYSDDPIYETILSAFCRSNGIDFFDLRPTFESAERSGAKLFLPHDGHFNAPGAQLAARAVAEHFNLMAAHP